MNKTLIIVADLGLFRAYRKTQNASDRQPHLKLIEELKLESAHEKMSDQLSDQAGRFSRGGGAYVLASLRLHRALAQAGE